MGLGLVAQAGLGATARSVSASILGWTRSLIFSTAVQTATFVAVDRVTDLVLGKEAGDEDSVAELALDTILSVWLYRKGASSVRAARSRARAMRYSSREQFRSFASSLGRTPTLFMGSLAAKFAASATSRSRTVQWMFSRKTGTLHLFGKKSGKLIGSVSKAGLTIPGVKSIGEIAIVLKNPKVALTSGTLTAVGLSLLAEQICFVAEEAGIDISLDTVDGDLLSNDDRLSFIRDPDMWLDQFKEEANEDPLVDMVDLALDWFFNNSSKNADLVVVEDEEDSDDPTQGEVDDFISNHVNLKTGEIDWEGKSKLVDTQLVRDVEQTCIGVRGVCLMERESRREDVAERPVQQSAGSSVLDLL